MDQLIVAECQYNTDPPNVALGVQVPVYGYYPIGNIPIHDYQRLRQLNPSWPDIVCDGNTLP